MSRGIFATVGGIYLVCTVVVCPLFAPCRGGGGEYEPPPRGDAGGDVSDAETVDGFGPDAESRDSGAADADGGASGSDASDGTSGDALDTAGDD